MRLSACACYTLLVLLCLRDARCEGDEQCKPPETSEVEDDLFYRTPGTIIDITKELHPGTVKWDSQDGLEDFIVRDSRIEKGDPANQSRLKSLKCHTATHIDAPGHWLHDYYEAGKGIESLDLYKLNGPALVVDVPYDSNITANVMEHLRIPDGVHRLLFRTQNTVRGLMHETPFHTDYTAMTEDGAEWLVNHTTVELVGIDYTSIAIYEDLKGPHHALLSKEIIPVEGLVMDHVAPGIYDLHCLPIKIVGSDGAPARCILIA